MEASRLSCERRVDIGMCIHPDHSEVWALPCVATDRTKRQAGSTEAVFSHHFSFRTTTRTMESLCSFSQPCYICTYQTSVTVKGSSHTNCMACCCRDSRSPSNSTGLQSQISQSSLLCLFCHPSHTLKSSPALDPNALENLACYSPFFYSNHDTFPHSSFLHALPS